MKKTIGILAHVDAGKTTFSEQVLCLAHAIRTPGRVDHGDAFLDSHPLERERGITIFSDQACFEYRGDEWTWVDTPGHADFSGETERAVSVMDYAVLLIDCAEGVQSHTLTVFRLLERYGVPAFLFLNKTDRAGADPDAAVARIRRRLTSDVLDLRGAMGADGTLTPAAAEAAAENDEALMDALFAAGYDRDTWLRALREMVRARRVFPLMAGSALRGEGIEPFMDMLSLLTVTDHEKKASLPFSAKAYKVRFDAGGTKLVFLKIASGSLAARDEVMTAHGPCQVTGIRRFSGPRSRQLPAASAGDVVAVTGLADVTCGETVGEKCEKSRYLTQPMLLADVRFPPEVPPDRALALLRQLEQEEPTLGVRWSAQAQSLEVRVLGPIQLEVLKELIRERFGISVAFGPAKVCWKETVSQPCFGIGHYEPLRHYAEVHLRIDPAPRGSGISFGSECHVDDLALNWQRLIETHVFEYEHKGVLTGSPLTDVKVTLLAGRAHLKHTEGGDFREATYRAVRNALMHAKSVLLEPVCRFEMRAPSALAGKLLGDLARMKADADPPAYDGEDVVFTGLAVFSRMMEEQKGFASLTGGRGALNWRMDHYAPCEEAQAAIESCGYRPEADDSPDSVFCAKGAGFVVPWDRVRDHAHLKSAANP